MKAFKRHGGEGEPILRRKGAQKPREVSTLGLELMNFFPQSIILFKNIKNIL